MKLRKTFQFEAAHLLPTVPTGHKCGRLHGHSYLFEVEVRGPVIEREGWVMDFDALDEIVAPVLDALDHRYLNDVPELENPTSEHIARWIYERIDIALVAWAVPRGIDARLWSVLVRETCTSSCVYAPKEELS